MSGNTERTDDYVQAACAWFYDGFRYQKCSGDISCAYEPDSYLKKLGVTTIELMPVYEFEEIELPKQQKLPEYIRWKEKQTDQIRPAEKK